MDLPRTPSFSLKGKKALVVGASSGIGLGCAVALAEAGAEVHLMARSAQKLQRIVASMIAKGWEARALPNDVSDHASTEDLISDLGPFDILVNSAGTARHAHADRVVEQDFDAVMGLNLKAAFFVAQAVAKGLIRAKKPGSIITISSQMGHVGGPERSVYCASKFGVEGMTRAMAVDFGANNIRVNTICPTFVRTALSAPTFDDPLKSKWITDQILLDRVAGVEDIMGAVTFLASDAAAMITGTSLVIDGGWTAH